MEIIRFWAHSENGSGEPNLLRNHLRNTASLCQSFAEKFDAENIGYLLGLIHDIGKYSDDFQNYLRENNDSVDHKTPGAMYAQKMLSFLSFPIFGHHGGLPDREKLKDRTQKVDFFQRKTDSELVKRFEKDLDISIPKSIDSLPRFLNPQKPDNRRIEFFVRMLYSCLVDADFLDTEAHFESEASELRGHYESLDVLWERFKQKQEVMTENAEESFVNKKREAIYQDCLERAGDDPGFFSLTVPTGGGKTRSGMGFALKHALKHDMDRVIVVIPYTSIIEQNADVYRDIFGDKNVVEHHSSLSPERETERNRLFSENWDAPVIVTTTVQFFGSLMAHKPSRCRKLHNIANSVVILDEIQTLPPKYIESILDVLEQFVRNYGTSIVFSTATQPAFEKRPEFPGIANIREIVSSPENLYRDLRRTEYHVETESLDDDELTGRIHSHDQVLLVLNTVDRAQAVYKSVKSRQSDGTYHLSGGMCGAHKRDVMGEIKNRLSNSRPCRLVSTQCVEAGVDLDFPVVYRAVGPMDSIAQAAGRCNREGNQDRGDVFIIEPEDQDVPPGAYRTGTDVARKFLQDDPDWHSPDLFRKYFEDLYSLTNLDKSSSEGKPIQKMRTDWQFEKVGKTFRLIEQITVPVVVPYGRAEELLEEHDPRFLDRAFYRDVQPYIVNLSKYKLEKAMENGLCAEYSDSLYKWTDPSAYDEGCGVRFEERGVLIG